MLRDIPSVEKLLQDKELKQCIDKYRHNYCVAVIREVLDKYRKSIINHEIKEVKYAEIIIRIKDKFDSMFSLKNVINATGVVLHTNLGRSPLPEDVCDHISKINGRYNNLEFSLDTGKRGSRYDHITEKIRLLTGFEDAVIVNNNAAAVMLILNVFARGKEAIVPRSQLVEIGGSFRVPKIMELSGTKLVEVGTTNCNHIYDFEEALSENTSMVMKVHRSNFSLKGFVKEVSSSELIKFSKENNVIFYEDLGSGILFENAFNKKETTVTELAEQADIVSFSGDKFLGGPQCGIILGKRKYIEQLKKAQLLRAFRVGKLTISALEATLENYAKKDENDKVLSLNMLNQTYEKIEERSNKIHETLFEKGIQSRVEAGTSLVGGGSMPDIEIPSPKIFIKTDLEVEQIKEELRNLKTPIILSVKDNELIIDLRTVFDDEEEYLVDSIVGVLQY